MTQQCLPRTSLLHGPFRMKSILRPLLALLVLVLLCYICGLSTTNSATWKLQNTPARIAADRDSGGHRKDEGVDVKTSDEEAHYRRNDSKQSSNSKFVDKVKGESKRLVIDYLSKKKKHQSLGLQREESAVKNSFAPVVKYNSDSATERSGPWLSLSNHSNVKENVSPEDVPASHAGRLLSPARKGNSSPLGNAAKEISGPSSLLSLLEGLVNGFKQPQAVERKDVVTKDVKTKEKLRDPSTSMLHPSTEHNAPPQGGPMAALKGKHSSSLDHGNGARKLKEASLKEQDAMTAKGDSKPSRSRESLSRSSAQFTSSPANASEATISAGDHDTASSTDRLPFDLQRRVWSPWRTDPSCRRHTVHFTLGAPPCALASYPGSGNTWARYLIEAASGIHTGSVYQDDQLFLNGYRGEMETWNAGTTLVQKVHEYSGDRVKSFQGRVVLLLRNPYRAILSFHNFLFGGHKGYAPVANYRRKDWDTFLHMQMKAWMLTAMTWLQEGSSLHVLHYEHLLQDPAPHLDLLLKDLDAPTDLERLSCIKKHTGGLFHRQKEYLPDDLKVFSKPIREKVRLGLPDDLKVFSKPIREKIDRAIRYVDFLLQQRNLPPLPLPLYEFYNFTLSDQIVRVPCPKEQTADQCDYYVDHLNRESKRRSSSSSPPPTAAPGGDVPPPPPLPRGEEDGTAHTPVEDTRLTILERLSQNKLTNKLTDVFMDFLQPYSENPLQAMIKKPNLKDFLAKPVHFEGAHGHEAEQLARDYIWPLGAKGYRGSLGKTKAKEESR